MKPPPLKHTSWADSGIMVEALVEMHIRSEAASAPAKAQQHPQFDWSRMSPMIFAHWGQFSAESKLSGISIVASKGASTSSPRWTKSFTIIFWSPPC